MKYQPYPAYKESGIEWLGKIPDGWLISKLGFEAWVRARLGWKGLKAEEYVDDGYIFLSTPNIKEREIDFENVNFINHERFNESPEIQLKVNDVLLAKDGSTLGTVNIIRELPKPATVNSSIAVISSQSRLEGLYLKYLLDSSFMKSVIQLFRGGMGVPHLFQEDINKFWIPLPPLPTQRIIAAFLDTETTRIDSLVKDYEELVALLQEKRQALISHAVTRGLSELVRPDDPEFGEWVKPIKFKDSGVEWIGEIPVEWEVSCVRYHFIIGRGRVIALDALEDEGMYPVYSSQTLNNGCLGFIDTFDFDCRQITWTTDGVNAGTVFLREGKHNCTNVCGTLLPKDDKIHLEYIHYLLSIGTEFYKRPDTNGAKIMNNEMAVISIVLPPLRTQLAIAAFLDRETTKIDTLVTEAQSAIELLKEHRAALITNAVTGKINVENLANAGKAETA